MVATQSVRPACSQAAREQGSDSLRHHMLEMSPSPRVKQDPSSMPIGPSPLLMATHRHHHREPEGRETLKA